jgi:hypothetical protein
MKNTETTSRTKNTKCYEAMEVPMLMYASENWTKIDQANGMRFLRSVVGHPPRSRKEVQTHVRI